MGGSIQFQLAAVMTNSDARANAMVYHLPSCFFTAATELPTLLMACSRTARLTPKCLIQYSTSSSSCVDILLRSAGPFFVGNFAMKGAWPGGTNKVNLARSAATTARLSSALVGSGRYDTEPGRVGWRKKTPRAHERGAELESGIIVEAILLKAHFKVRAPPSSSYQYHSGVL